MTLPFEQESERKRFLCFVCGKGFPDGQFEEFKEHIKTEHDEGRDFIVCPLDRCQAPVRDLVTHFKAKHPTEKLPKNCQFRAIIWRDICPKTNKMKTRKPKFRQGNHESTKMRKTFSYKSGWEKTVFECLDLIDDIVAYDYERCEIPYLHKGEPHKYYPDLLVAFADGHKELWEIKPANQNELEMNIDKWHAAEQACLVRGWGWRVINEEQIEVLKDRANY